MRMLAVGREFSHEGSLRASDVPKTVVRSLPDPLGPSPSFGKPRWFNLCAIESHEGLMCKSLEKLNNCVL